MAMALVGFASACGAAPEKVEHPEPVVSSPVAPPPVTAAAPPPPAAPAPVAPPAAPSPPPANDTYVPGVACEVRGAPVLPKGVNLWAEAQGSTATAGFAGQPVSLVVSAFPASAKGRIRVRTTGGVRIDGYVDASDLPIFAGSEVGVAEGHLWLAQGQRVAFVSAANGVTVEASVSGPVTQTFRVTAPCSSLALDKRQRVPWEIPGNGRGYLPQRSSIELRDQPGGNVIQTLHTGPGMLLWSTESRGDYVHVVYHEDVVIDAWVAAADLAPLKQGETMDRLAPASSVTGTARLAMSGQTTLVRAQKEVPLRLSPQTTAKPVGSIETGGEVYLIQTVLGWTSVLPRALNVLPPGERSFWVPASEVGSVK